MTGTYCRKVVTTKPNVSTTEATVARPAMERSLSRILLIRRLCWAPTAYCRASASFNVTIALNPVCPGLARCAFSSWIRPSA